MTLSHAPNLWKASLNFATTEITMAASLSLSSRKQISCDKLPSSAFLPNETPSICIHIIYIELLFSLFPFAACTPRAAGTLFLPRILYISYRTPVGHLARNLNTKKKEAYFVGGIYVTNREMVTYSRRRAGRSTWRRPGAAVAAAAAAILIISGGARAGESRQGRCLLLDESSVHHTPALSSNRRMEQGYYSSTVPVGSFNFPTQKRRKEETVQSRAWRQLYLQTQTVHFIQVTTYHTITTVLLLYSSYTVTRKL